MKKAWSEIWNTHYSELEWLCAKIAIIYAWLIKVTFILFSYNTVPLPTGVFTWVDMSVVQYDIFRYTIIVCCYGFGLAYLLEKRMLLSTFSIFVLSVFTFSLEESNGILNRYSLLSFIFFAQFLAYVIPAYYSGFKYSQLRFTFSIQAVVAAYFLSAISKLTTSGDYWFNSSKYLSLQIIKSHYYNYVNNADLSFLESGNKLALSAQENNFVVTVLLTSSLILELFVWISIGNKKRTLVYGILLMLMHIGIKLIMEISLVGILRPMLIFMVNPLFVCWVLLIKPVTAFFKTNNA